MRFENKEAGKELNELYEKFIADPNNEEIKNRLFSEVDNFARRITAKTAGSKASYLNDRATDEDISQSVALKVWQNLEKFQRESKFSTWVYQIAENQVLDSLRQIKQRQEVRLKKWRAYDVPSAGFRGSAKGIGPDGRKGIGINAEDDTADSSGGGHARAPILAGNYLSENQNGINAQIDFERAFQKLSARDQKIVGLFRDGYKPSEIGKELGHDAKWASNQLTRLKELLKHEMYVAETILHSCKRSVQPTTVLEEGRFYTDEGDGYCSLPLCRCKKQLTALEAETLIQNGEAHPVYKIKDGAPVVVRQEVWAQQAVRVPRVGLNSNKADIERAFVDGNRQSQSDIEVAYELTLEFRRKLIRQVPAAEYDRLEQEQFGRAVFSSFSDQKTPGGHQDPEWTPPPAETEDLAHRAYLKEKRAVNKQIAIFKRLSSEEESDTPSQVRVAVAA